jgi:hypothetical protein
MELDYCQGLSQMCSATNYSSLHRTCCYQAMPALQALVLLAAYLQYACATKSA